MLTIRQKIAFYLEDIETPIGRTISLLITGLILLSSAFFVAETYDIPENIRQEMELLDRGILLIFTVEYLLRFWGAENPIKFFFKVSSLIDLAVILPLFLGSANISYLRIFRWLRVLRLIRFLEFKIAIFNITTEDGVILARIIFTLFTIIFVFSGLIFQVEHLVNPENFQTFLDAIYFSVVTMTTVGFGDLTPKSEAGKFLTILMILTGIALIPWQLGDLIKQLLKTRQVNIICTRCHSSTHDENANFCKMCGSKLEDTPTSIPNSKKTHNLNMISSDFLSEHNHLENE